MENQKLDESEKNHPVGCFTSKESLVSTILRRLQKYVANVGKALERLIDTRKKLEKGGCGKGKKNRI